MKKLLFCVFNFFYLNSNTSDTSELVCCKKKHPFENIEPYSTSTREGCEQQGDNYNIVDDENCPNLSEKKECIQKNKNNPGHYSWDSQTSQCIST